MKLKAFTLAEILITLGIIGIVAALTMPSLIQKYQKYVYYTQFKKAVSQVENAFKMYQLEHDCYSDINLCDVGNLGRLTYNTGFVDEFAKYFKVVNKINVKNYDEVCDGYNKIKPQPGYERNIDFEDEDGTYSSLICGDMTGSVDSSILGFVTADGLLLSFDQDFGSGGSIVMDTNGSNKGPNLFGRDMYVFYLDTFYNKLIWGGDVLLDNNGTKCQVDDAYGCAMKLLIDGKMDY